MTASSPGGIAKLAPKASLGERRMAVTYIAAVCDDPQLQPKLPQVVVATKRFLTKKLKQSIKTPASVTLLAEKSAWNNSAIMVKVLTMLADALKEELDKRHIVLMLDVAQCHLSKAVLQEARRLKFWLVFVPAASTPFLQPLDTTVFKGFKAYMLRGFARLQLASAAGSVSHRDFLELLSEAAVKHMCSHKWTRAFRSVGAGTTAVEQLSPQLQQLVGSWEVEASPPAKHQLEQIFPQGKRPCPTEFLSLPRRRLRGKTSV